MGDGNTECCVNGKGVRIFNHCYLKYDAYVFVIPHPGNSCESRCKNLYPGDEETYCCSRTESYDGRRVMMITAMETEILLGMFDPVMWSRTFPERTREPIKKMRDAISVALEEPLILPLTNIVCAYLGLP